MKFRGLSKAMHRSAAPHVPAAGAIETSAAPIGTARAAVPAQCANCQWFDAPDEKPEGVDAAQWIIAGKGAGWCQRFPQSVRKAPHQRCGEFDAKEEHHA